MTVLRCLEISNLRRTCYFHISTKMNDVTSAPLKLQERVAVMLPDCQDTIQIVGY